MTTLAKTQATLRCSACSRPLTRAAYTVGRLTFGSSCFKKLLAEGRKAKRTELTLEPASDLLAGCYFDQRATQDRQYLMGSNL